jgi:L-threonylcarbamoyladenylate synthase
MNDDLINALAILQKGGIILYPTDTIWGLGCDATNNDAVQRLYDLKGRTESKHMLILMENPALLDRYVTEVPEIAWDLIGISTTPLTIIYPGAKNLAEKLIAQDGSIGIRFTSEKFSSELIRRFRKPVVSTSANFSGKPSPSVFSEIDKQIVKAADYVVKYRQEETIPSKPSGIIRLGPGGRVEIIRK